MRVKSQMTGQKWAAVLNLCRTHCFSQASWAWKSFQGCCGRTRPGSHSHSLSFMHEGHTCSSVMKKKQDFLWFSVTSSSRAVLLPRPSCTRWHSAAESKSGWKYEAQPSFLDTCNKTSLHESLIICTQDWKWASWTAILISLKSDVPMPKNRDCQGMGTGSFSLRERSHELQVTSPTWCSPTGSAHSRQSQVLPLFFCL